MSLRQAALETRRRAPRALAARPALRRLCVLLWASFLGAVLMLLSVLLLPDSLPLPPASPTHQALFFGLAWLVSLLPATVAGVLLMDESPRA